MQNDENTTFKCPKCESRILVYDPQMSRNMRSMGFVLRFAILVSLCAIVAHVAHHW